MTDRVHVVMPASVRDPERPSGGNAYDLRVCTGLGARGWSVREHEVTGSWPCPDETALAALTQVFASVPPGDLALVDGLVASSAPEALVAQSNRLRVGVLVHVPLGQSGDAGAPARERERRAFAAADVIVVTSEWTGSWLLEAYQLDPARVHVAVPGADPGPVSAGSATGGRLLAVGPVSRAKGHDTLLSALDRLTSFDWRLDCVGSLSVDREAARRVAAWGGTTDRVHLRGPLSTHDVQSAYASADLLVHPSRAETYGMVVTEALARGVPVVAADVGGTREAMGLADGDRTLGLLVEPGDVDGLTAALTTWLTDADWRRTLRRAALVRREQLPTWDATVTAVGAALRTTALVGAQP